MKIVTFSLETGNNYFGKVDGGPKFFIGKRVSYQGNKGLMNVTGTAAQRYDRNAYAAQHGFWAHFIHPTATAEGALFHTLNTYDRARFTFTFLQYAAHVPNGDFVQYFRALLALPDAIEYFPDLVVDNGRICKVEDDGLDPLESDGSTEGLMAYFNPTLSSVEDTEVIQAAKLIHWAQNDPAHRDIQIDLGIAHFREAMRGYAQRYGLDGAPDVVCLVVADIRHQGRASSSAILQALAMADPLEALLELGEPTYHSRLVTLRREIKRLVDEGTLGQKTYSMAAHDFV